MVTGTRPPVSGSLRPGFLIPILLKQIGSGRPSPVHEASKTTDLVHTYFHTKPPEFSLET